MPERDGGCTGGYGRCLMQIHNIYPFQRIDDSNWFFGAGVNAVSNRAGFGPCTCKGRGGKSYHSVLAAYKFLDKTKHRPLMPSFRKFGAAVNRIAVPTVCLFAIIVIPAYLGSNANEYYYGSSKIFNEETQLGRDIESIEEVFGQRDTYVLLVPRGDTATETALSDELHELPQITSIISYVDMAGAEIPLEYLDEDTLSQLMSENYSRMVLSVDASYEGEETFSLVETIRHIAQSYYPDTWYLAGEGVSTYDLMDTVTADMVKVNLAAIASFWY